MDSDDDNADDGGGDEGDEGDGNMLGSWCTSLASDSDLLTFTVHVYVYIF